MKNSFGSLVRALMFRHILTVWHGAKIAFRNTSFLFFLLVINIAPIFVTMAWSLLFQIETETHFVLPVISIASYYVYIIAIPTFLKLTFAGIPPSLYVQAMTAGAVIKTTFIAVCTFVIAFAIGIPILMQKFGTLVGAGNFVAYMALFGLIAMFVVIVATSLILYFLVKSLLGISSRSEILKYILRHLSFFLFIFSMYFIIIFAIYGMQFRMLPSMDTDPVAYAKLPPWYVQLAIKTVWQSCIVCVDYVVICALYVYCTQNPLDAAVIEDAPATTPPAV